MFVYSPLEQFEVVSLISLNAPVLGYLNLSLTNLGLYSLIVFLLVTGVHLAFKGTGGSTLNDTKLIPSTWSIALESSFASINAIVREQIGLRNEIYLPFIYSLFVRDVGQFTVILSKVVHYPNMFTTLELGERENLRLNRASLVNMTKSLNLL